MQNESEQFPAVDDPPLELRERFGITPLLDTEINVGAVGWVGLTPEADHQLRIDVTSAVIARHLGSSISTARKYVSDMEEHCPRDNLIRNLCHSHLSQYDEFYRTIPIRENAPIGIFAFDLAMIRSRSSIELMLVTARQGFLIEPCLIARSLMEQFAYGFRVWPEKDEEIIFSSKPQALIRELSKVNPNSGRAYGLLSKLSHYDPKMHYSFIGGYEKNSSEEKSSTVLQRSWKFKIASLAWLFFILDLKSKIFEFCYGRHENFTRVISRGASIVDVFDEFFKDVDLPAVHEVRALLK